MLYPKIGKNRNVTLKIPDFSGGIEASKPAQDIQDNQAVSVSNMWLKDGILQTRPALKSGSINACQPANAELSDLELDMKYGCTLYNSANAVISDTVQEKGHLFRLGKEFYFYNLESKTFIPIDIKYSTDAVKNLFLIGKIEHECFLENGTYTQTITVDEEKKSYYEIVHSKIYGYIALRETEESELKRIFVCAKFVLSNEKITVTFDMYDFSEALPVDYTPFNPTVILGSGTTVENLDDFNLMADTFKQQITIDKGLAQYTTKYGIDSAEAKSMESYYSHLTGASFNHNLGDGSAEFGNRYLNKRINFNFSEIENSTIDQIVIYGQFQFGCWKANYIENGQTWEKVDEEKIYDSSTGELITTKDIYGGVDFPDGYYVDPITGFMVCATATKLVISNINTETKELTWKYYDNDGNIVNPSKKFRTDIEGFVIYPSINRGMDAECTDTLLSVWFPTNFYTIKTYYKGTDEYYNLLEYPDSFPGAGIYIEEVQIFQSLTTQENRTDLVIKNPLKTTFGGTNSGYNGGTRLFVAGNPEHKNVLRWSAVNDFSYFLENNFTYIGRDDEEITALGKQDGYLVVFKERELYAVEYASTTDSNNELVVYFPVTPISPYIGCDCPQSIQFIANRLTWLTSSGKVYTLYSENSYSERNVREISKHIENELKKHTKEELKAAKSVDYNGNYMLFVGKTVYIWNYDANPLYNYTSSERAQQNLCWFRWDFPYPVDYVCENDGELTVICNDGTDYQGYVLDYSEDADDTVGADDTIPITSTYKSKLWDFGSPFTFKRISRALFEVQTANDGEIKVYFCTEKGREPIPSILNAQYTTTENTTHTTRPHLARVRSIGFELESDIAVKLYSAAVSAEIYGEVK